MILRNNESKYYANIAAALATLGWRNGCCPCCLSGHKKAQLQGFWTPADNFPMKLTFATITDESRQAAPRLSFPSRLPHRSTTLCTLIHYGWPALCSGRLWQQWVTVISNEWWCPCTYTLNSHSYDVNLDHLWLCLLLPLRLQKIPDPALSVWPQPHMLGLGSVSECRIMLYNMSMCYKNKYVILKHIVQWPILYCTQCRVQCKAHIVLLSYEQSLKLYAAYCYMLSEMSNSMHIFTGCTSWHYIVRFWIAGAPL